MALNKFESTILKGIGNHNINQKTYFTPNVTVNLIYQLSMIPKELKAI